MGLYLGGLITGRIFASKIGGLFFQDGLFLFLFIFFLFFLFFAYFVIFFFFWGGGLLLKFNGNWGIFFKVCSPKKLAEIVYYLYR